MELRQITQSIADGERQWLQDGTLFRSIRGLQSKVFLVNFPNALTALASFISTDETSNQALRAVAQAAANTDGLAAAKESEQICWTIAQIPGLLNAVISRIEQDVDAVRLVNNLAANSVQAAALFASIEGSIVALKEATKRFRLHAFGVINHLSRFEVTATAMINQGFVEDLLNPAVDIVEEKLSLEQEATVARASLALANLSAVSSKHCPCANRKALAIVVKVLDYAARGETLATITWLPTTVLFGLSNMTSNEINCQVLLESDVSPVLSNLLNAWEPAAGPESLLLALHAISNLSCCSESFGFMCSAGLIQAVERVAAGERGEAGAARGVAAHVIQGAYERHVAVCMGHQRRLGQGSALMALDDAVLFMILHFAFRTPPAVHTAAFKTLTRPSDTNSRFPQVGEPTIEA